MIAAANPAARAEQTTDEVVHTVIGNVPYRNLAERHLPDDAKVRLAIEAAVAQHCERFHRKTNDSLSIQAKRFVAHAGRMTDGWYPYKVNQIGGKEPYVCTVMLCKQDKSFFAEVIHKL